MADLTVTASKVRVVYAEKAEFHNGIVASGVTLAPGDVVYQKTDGTYDKCDADAIGTGVPAGICYDDATAGFAFSFIQRGYLAGFDLSGLNPGARLFTSSTAGKVPTYDEVEKIFAASFVEGQARNGEPRHCDAEVQSSQSAYGRCPRPGASTISSCSAISSVVRRWPNPTS